MAVAGVISRNSSSNQEDVVAGVSVQPGDLVYVASSGELMFAQADSTPQALALGMVVEAASAGSTTAVLTHGSLTLIDWTSVTGAPSLTPGAVYYLDTSTPGNMVTSAPLQGSGAIMVPLGTAVSADTFHFERRHAVRR